MAIGEIGNLLVRKASRSLGTESIRNMPAAIAPTMTKDSLVITGRAAAPATAEQGAEAYRMANQRLVGKYPTLDVVLKDPDAFVAEMRSRFAQQKQLDPQHPYKFDFSEYGLPVLKGWSKLLDDEAADLKGQIRQLQGAPHSASQIQERQLTLDHVHDLKAEVEGHLQSGSIDYQRMQELSLFTSRAMGRFDTQTLSVRDRKMLRLDRHLQGHRELPIAEERARFQRNETVVFDAQSAVRNFKTAQGVYEKGFMNPKSLDMLVLPTSEPLSTDVFMRLAPYDIFLQGVTREPIAADGFVRPSADFRVHDDRHNSDIYAKHVAYKEKHQLTQPQIEKLTKQVDVWQEQLGEAKKTISAPELLSAVNFLAFNYHHDRGIPTLPSSFESPTLNRAYIPRELYLALSVSGQKQTGGAAFASPAKNLDRAYEWLRAFWLPKLQQEQQIVGAKSPLGMSALI